MQAFRFPRPAVGFALSLVLLVVAAPHQALGHAVQPLALNPASINFGSVAVGSSQTQVEAVTNTRGYPVVITQAAISGMGFSLSGLNLPLQLSSNQTATFSLGFAPSGAGSFSGKLQMSFKRLDGGRWIYGTASVALSGTGTGTSQGQLAASPISLNFGSVLVSNTSTLPLTLTNSQTTAVQVSQVVASGTGFSVSGFSLPINLSAGQSVTLSVGFTPPASGTDSGNITVTSNANNPSLSIPLVGNGASSGQLAVSPATLSFGSVNVGNSKNMTGTLSASSGSITVAGARLRGTGFSLSGISFPITLAAGQSLPFTVSFAPLSTGSFSGTLQMTYKRPDGSRWRWGTAYVALSGTGSGASSGQLAANPTSLTFGSVQVNKTSTLPLTLTNNQTTAVQVSQVKASGTGFSVSGFTLPISLAAGQSVALNVNFTPPATGTDNGSVTVTSDANNPSLSVSLSGTGTSSGQLAANPTSLSFGSVQVNKTSTLSLTLTNNQTTSVQVSQLAASGTGFSVSGFTLPINLSAGQSVSVNANFTPSASGTFNGSVTVTSNANNPSLSVSLTGTGANSGLLAANPTSLSFGSVEVSKTSTLPFTLTNSESTAVQISSVKATGAGYSVSGFTLPINLSAGQSVTVNATFAPAASGAASGSVAVSSDANNPSLAVSLSGTGTSSGQLAANPTNLTFGSVQVSKSSTLPFTLTNNQNTAVQISSVKASGAGFGVSGFTLPIDLSAGQSVTVNATFAPTASGAASGSVAVSSNANNPSLSVSLSGTGTSSGQLAANPTSLSFGSVQVNKTSTLSLTLTNNQTTSVQVSQLAASGTGFSVSGFSLPINLTAGQSVTVNASFTPSASGAASGSIAISSNANNPSLSVSLSGTGASSGQLAVSPTTLSFGTVNVGSTKNMAGTLSASSNSVTISSASWNGPGFSVSGISFPVTLAAGQSMPFTVTFAPQSAGSATGLVSFVSNAGNTPTNENLTGSGATVTQHSVSLSWNPNASTVQGYYVYRGSQSGGPYTRISSLLTSPSYTDSTVASSQTYFYVVTAMGTNSVESGYSNEAVATIP